MAEKSPWKKALADLLTGYKDGLYTRLELPSKVIDIINADNFEALWSSLPDWVQHDIADHVPAVTEVSEVIALGGGQPEDVRRQLLLVKRLLIEHGVVDQRQVAELD